MSVQVKTLPGLVESVPEARRFVRQTLLELGAPAACDDAETLVSELATNAVLHAHSEYTIAVLRDGATVRVRVHDLSAVLPRQRAYGPDSTTGRGVRLIATLASDWGVEREGAGKAVWFELPADGDTGQASSWDDELDVDALLAAFGEDDVGTPDGTTFAMAA